MAHDHNGSKHGKRRKNIKKDSMRQWVFPENGLAMNYGGIIYLFAPRM